MLAGVNDSDDDARRLLQLLDPIYCMVNLIHFNAHEGTRFRGSSEERINAFKAVLSAGGLVCTLRMSKGDDEMAACGQLGDLGLAERPAPMLRPPPRLREACGGTAAAAGR
jgi:23S rRNA (adenine2503-C2)-methyltransferase